MQMPLFFFQKYKRPFDTASLLVFLFHLVAHACGTHFASYVTVNTPVHSFRHGVGDPLPMRGYQGYRSSSRPPVRQTQRQTQQRGGGGGYPRLKPRMPFDSEETRGDGFNSLSWPYDDQQETSIPVLPPSPYKVDSPDPESLWPEGLFLPPVSASRSGFGRRTDAEPETVDPYLVLGSEAIAAVGRARQHGVYFHDVPHVESLLALQRLRARLRLRPHRLASIRHTWPFNRP
ncbi:uncharacterized protein LOC134741811 [Cydia strobilella]|uniref:uncharacterized protein LOC134741811 n=1 Tax=Cydia strobilella TaxID=1100964 RepID=UPI00300723AF